jgi:hypothetical protein
VSRESSGGLLFLWSLCVFGCISVIEEGVCVRDCRSLVLYKVGIIGCSVDNECEKGGVVW